MLPSIIHQRVERFPEHKKLLLNKFTRWEFSFFAAFPEGYIHPAWNLDSVGRDLLPFLTNRNRGRPSIHIADLRCYGGSFLYLSFRNVSSKNFFGFPILSKIPIVMYLISLLM